MPKHAPCRKRRYYLRARPLAIPDLGRYGGLITTGKQHFQVPAAFTASRWIGGFGALTIGMMIIKDGHMGMRGHTGGGFTHPFLDNGERDVYEGLLHGRYLEEQAHIIVIHLHPPFPAHRPCAALCYHESHTSDTLMLLKQ